MNKSQLQKIYNLPIYPRDSKIYSDKGFVNIDNVEWERIIRGLFMSKITNRSIWTVSVFNQINFH